MAFSMAIILSLLNCLPHAGCSDISFLPQLLIYLAALEDSSHSKDPPVQIPPARCPEPFRVSVPSGPTSIRPADSQPSTC